MGSPTKGPVPVKLPHHAPLRRWLVMAALLLLATLCLAPATRAATLGDVQVPDTLQVDGKPLVLNGVGLRTLTFLRVKIYVAALYLPKRSSDARAILASPGPKAVALHYIHGGSKEQVQGRYREGEKENCGTGGCDAALQGDFEKLVASAQPVREGDITNFVVTERGFRVLFNGRPVVSFTDSRLGNMMIEGFIGAHPPSEELRAALLGVPTN
jgi:chalcone isomerase-like protein